MGTYTVKTPAGATIDVEADDEQSALEKAAAQNNPTAPPPASTDQTNYTPLTDQDGDHVRLFVTPQMSEEDAQWTTPAALPGAGGAAGALISAAAGTDQTVNEAVDVAKSVPHYGKTLVSSAFGLPGDVIKFGRWLATKAGVETPQTPVLGSAEIGQGIESLTGELHEPETRLGKTVDIGAAILPGMFGGPGGLGAKFGIRVAAPAAAAGIAGALTEGTPLEPWAEVAALLVTPLGVSKAVEPLLQGALRKSAVLDTQQIRALERAEYKIANVAQHEIVTPAFENWFQREIVAKHSLNNPQMSATSKAASTVRGLMADAIASGQPITLKHMQEWRRLLGKALGKPDIDPFGVAGAMYQDINQFIKSLRPGVDLIGPDAAIAAQAMRNADALHVRFKNSQLLDKIYGIARSRIGRGYTSATGSETRNLQLKFEQLSQKIADTNSKEYRFFTPEMREAIKQVAEGTVTLRTLRAIGSFAPWSMKGVVATSATAMSAFQAFGDYISAIAAGAGIVIPAVARIGAEIMTRRRADAAADLIRMGGKLPPAAPGLSPGVPAFGVPQLLNDEDEKKAQ